MVHVERTRMLEYAKKLALEAGRRHAKAYRKAHITINYKGAFNPVIEQDTKTEKYLKNAIQKKYPTHGILGEEGTQKKGKNGFTWVIDPLDGTINFIRGFPYFTVSIGILKGKKPYIGVVYDPITKELFYAQRGKGAFLNGKRIHVSKTSKLANAYLSTGFRYKRGKGFTEPLKKIKKVLERTMVVRRTGSASLDLCNVAKGTFDGFFMYDTKKWDVVAGVAIILEAGGKFLSKEKTNHDLDIIVANPVITTQLKNLLRWHS